MAEAEEALRSTLRSSQLARAAPSPTSTACSTLTAGYAHRAPARATNSAAWIQAPSLDIPHQTAGPIQRRHCSTGRRVRLQVALPWTRPERGTPFDAGRARLDSRIRVPRRNEGGGIQYRGDWSRTRIGVPQVGVESSPQMGTQKTAASTLIRQHRACWVTLILNLWLPYAPATPIITNAITQGESLRFRHACFAPCCTMQSPASISINSPESISSVTSPDRITP